MAVDTLPGALALSEFCNDVEACRDVELTEELRSVVEVIALTGHVWHDWLRVRSLLVFLLGQVLDEYERMRMASETPDVGPARPLASGETYVELKERLIKALEAFQEGPPFTVQRLCELLLNPKQHSNLHRISFAFEKVLLVSSCAPFPREPYPSLPLEPYQREALYVLPKPMAEEAEHAHGPGQGEELPAQYPGQGPQGMVVEEEEGEGEEAAHGAGRHRVHVRGPGGARHIHDGELQEVGQEGLLVHGASLSERRSLSGNDERQGSYEEHAMEAEGAVAGHLLATHGDAVGQDLVMADSSDAVGGAEGEDRYSDHRFSDHRVSEHSYVAHSDGHGDAQDTAEGEVPQGAEGADWREGARKAAAASMELEGQGQPLRLGEDVDAVVGPGAAPRVPVPGDGEEAMDCLPELDGGLGYAMGEPGALPEDVAAAGGLLENDSPTRGLIEVQGPGQSQAQAQEQEPGQGEGQGVDQGPGPDLGQGQRMEKEGQGQEGTGRDGDRSAAGQSREKEEHGDEEKGVGSTGCGAPPVADSEEADRAVQEYLVDSTDGEPALLVQGEEPNLREKPLEPQGEDQDGTGCQEVLTTLSVLPPSVQVEGMTDQVMSSSFPQEVKLTASSGHKDPSGVPEVNEHSEPSEAAENPKVLANTE